MSFGFSWDQTARATLFALVGVWLFASSAQARCSALPIVSKLVLEIEQLQHLGKQRAIIASTWKIDGLRQRISKPSMYLKLSELGFERKLPTVMALKRKLEDLALVARDGNADAVQAFLSSPDFQRDYTVAKELTTALCIANDTAKQSKAAKKQFGALGALGVPPLTGIGTPIAAFGLLSLAVTSLIGLAYGTRLRRKRLGRERRRNKRYPCDMPVSITAPPHKSEQRLVDISRTGANMENALQLPEGTALTLDFGNVRRDVKVTWSNSQFAGVQFNHRLSKQEMEHVIATECTLNTSRNEKRDAVMGVAHMS